MKMKDNGKSILLIEHSPTVGGGQIMFLGTISALISSCIKIGIAIPTGGRLEIDVRRIINRSHEIIRVPEIILVTRGRSWFDWVNLVVGNIKVLLLFRKVKKYDLWYVNGARVLIGFGILAFLLRRRIIFHSHLKHKFPLKSFIALLVFFGVVKRVICPSKFILNDLQGWPFFKIMQRKCSLIPNCLAQSFSDLKFDDRFSDPNFTCRNIGVFGKISYAKGHDFAVTLARCFPEHKIFVVGGVLLGEEEFAISLKATAPKNLIFCGEVNSINEFIIKNRISFCVVPSRIAESFCLTAIEAMASSCITIAADRGALREISSKTGMLMANSFDEILVNMRALLSEQPNALKRKSFDQYYLTIGEYSFNRYRSSLKSLLHQILIEEQVNSL